MGIEAKPQDSRRLDSWKEIAGYFGRDERTVKRWEGQRGLPVYRAPGGGKTTVYAYAAELEAWLRRDSLPSAQSASSADSASARPTDLPASASSGERHHRRPLWVALGAGALAFAACVWLAIQWRADGSARLSASPEANRLYRNGLYSWQTRTPAGLKQAIVDFQRAIRADSRFAAAYAGLADCYNLLPEYTNTPASIAFPQAKAAAEHAISLDGRLAAAHRSLAYVDFWWSRDNTAAIREFQRALQLDPASAQTHHWYANALSAMGGFPEALRQIDIAEQLEPGSTALEADKGVLLADAGRVKEGIQILQQVENAQPQFAPAHSYLAFAYRMQHVGPAALREMRWHAQLVHDLDEAAIARAGGQGYAAGGYRGMLERMIPVEEALHVKGRFPLFLIATDYYRLGETERALALFVQSVASRERAAVSIRVEPELHGLYNDPRFAALVVREGFTLPKGM